MKPIELTLLCMQILNLIWTAIIMYDTLKIREKLGVPKTQDKKEGPCVENKGPG